MCREPGRYKGRVIPASVRPPTNTITIKDFTPRKWACLADLNINKQPQKQVVAGECKDLHIVYGCDACALNFNHNPELSLEWLVDSNSISKEVALEVLLMKEK